ncbi:MAG: hypothetical protein ABWX94_02355 [Candidatus Saccharimonadales bacterium]
MPNPNKKRNQLSIPAAVLAVSLGIIASNSGEALPSLAQWPTEVAAAQKEAPAPICTGIYASLGDQNAQTMFLNVETRPTDTARDEYRIKDVVYTFGDEAPGQPLQHGGRQRTHNYSEAGEYTLDAKVTIGNAKIDNTAHDIVLDCPDLTLTILNQDLS